MRARADVCCWHCADKPTNVRKARMASLRSSLIVSHEALRTEAGNGGIRGPLERRALGKPRDPPAQPADQTRCRRRSGCLAGRAVATSRPCREVPENERSLHDRLSRVLRAPRSVGHIVLMPFDDVGRRATDVLSPAPGSYGRSRRLPASMCAFVRMRRT
jgi:hypothetical protein